MPTGEWTSELARAVQHAAWAMRLPRDSRVRANMKVHRSVLFQGRLGAWRERTVLNSKGVATRATFCNRAVGQGLRRLGVNTTGLSGRTANEMFDTMRRESGNPNGMWVNVHDKSFVQDLANAGFSPVAAFRHPAGGHGHVALVSPGPARWTNHPKAPFITNVGAFGRTGVIPHTHSHESGFHFFVSRTDPAIDHLARSALLNIEKHGPAHTMRSNNWLVNNLGRASYESKPDFRGPPSYATHFVNTIDILNTARMESAPNFVGPPRPSTVLCRELGLI